MGANLLGAVVNYAVLGAALVQLRRRPFNNKYAAQAIGRAGGAGIQFHPVARWWFSRRRSAD